MDVSMASAGLGRILAPVVRLGRRSTSPAEVREFLEASLAEFPWRLVVTDWTGRSYPLGGDEAHWSGDHLRVRLRTPEAGRDLVNLNGMRFLERFLEGDVDLDGNLYLLSHVSQHARIPLEPWEILARVLRNAAFQSVRRAKVNVSSHYDIPQEALDVYLDRTYLSYSCAIWERPGDFGHQDLVTLGTGEHDHFDSLEKAQWRKFQDAADFIAPDDGQTLLDVGCGYGGQLAVALDRQPFGKVVGWTHSANQVTRGRTLLAAHDPARFELNQGDYRRDDRVYDHVTSTGMISHVGPRGLVPYVRNVRERVKTGGRYLHHALMTSYHPLPLDFSVGIAFNKKYVWPGFHWFTLGEHLKALEQNGFQVLQVRSLTRHYAKTTAAWYERMMAERPTMVENLGEPTFRAWQVFLAGITGSFLLDDTHVYRLYCQAVP